MREKAGAPQLASFGNASPNTQMLAASAALAAANDGNSLREALARASSNSFAADTEYLSRASKLFDAFPHSLTIARKRSA